MTQINKKPKQTVKELKLIKNEIEEHKDETFEDVIKQIENTLTYTAEKYIPRACEALKRDDPSLSSAGIRKIILEHPTINKVWTEGTIRQYWPQWMKSPTQIEAAKNRWEDRKTTEILEKNYKISQEEQDDIDRDEEQQPVKSWTLTEYEEEHPTLEESPFEIIGEINRSIARLWTALTKQKNMPTREDDVMKDYIIPARERLKDMLNGSNQTERDFLFNWLTWIIMATKDCRDLCEKADKTAYDTRNIN